MCSQFHLLEPSCWGWAIGECNGPEFSNWKCLWAVFTLNIFQMFGVLEIYDDLAQVKQICLEGGAVL